MNPILAGTPAQLPRQARPSPVVTSFRRRPNMINRYPSEYDLTFVRITENIKLVFFLGVVALIMIVILISSIAKAISGFKNTQEEAEKQIF